MKASRAVAIFAALALLLAVPCASAELTEKGDLFLRFAGGISPRALPRKTLAPIAVRIEGTIRVLARHDPPALRSIKIAINRGGQLNSYGLAVCHRDEIEAAATARALAICGSALVGGGGFTAETAVGNQPNRLVRGEILLFNSTFHGHAAILAHVYQHEPVPLTRFIVFRIQRSGGTFGTILAGQLPPGLNRNGYLKSIYLQLRRKYVFHGRTRSYLSASCAAPRGISVAAFPFAKASMTFDDGRTLSSTLTRSCRAEG